MLAATLATAYGLVLAVVAAVLLYELLGHHGHIGAEHLNGIAARGVTFTAGLLLLAACVLVLGAYRLLFKRRRGLLLAPLSVLLLIGTIGEIADLVGTASRTSNILGFGILVAAFLPIALVVVPSQSREWFPR